MREEIQNLIGKKIRLTRFRSAIRYSGKQKATIYALGLRKINASRELMVSRNLAGMIDRVYHMVEIEEVT